MVPGVTVIEDVVSFPGDHKYVPPLMFTEAVNVAEDPGQIVLEFTFIVGEALTVTVPLTGKLSHPPFEYTTE